MIGGIKMSNEVLLGILVTIVFGVAALLIYTKRNTLNVNQNNKNGNADMNNNTISNEININKKD